MIYFRKKNSFEEYSYSPILCDNGCLLLSVQYLGNRNNILENQLPRKIVSCKKVLSYCPHFIYNSDITLFLYIMIQTNQNRDMEFQPITAKLYRGL